VSIIFVLALWIWCNSQRVIVERVTWKVGPAYGNYYHSKANRRSRKRKGRQSIRQVLRTWIIFLVALTWAIWRPWPKPVRPSPSLGSFFEVVTGGESDPTFRFTYDLHCYLRAFQIYDRLNCIERLSRLLQGTFCRGLKATRPFEGCHRCGL
jgi:hypothetical protein